MRLKPARSATDDLSVNLHLPRWMGMLREWVPTGNFLSDARWPERHRVMVRVLWLHVFGIGVLGSMLREDPAHLAAGVGLLGAGAVLAGSGRFGRCSRTLAAVLTLLSSSAFLVHLTDGLTESHFHFFVVVAFLTLYQDWLPFAVALAFVGAHHGLLGLWQPQAVFGHEVAWAQPGRWALLHGAFVALATAASWVAWRLSEVERERVEQLIEAAGDGIYGVDGSGRITFANPTLCHLVNRERSELEGMDAHTALGHRSVRGCPSGPSDCPLCVAVTHKKCVETGELCMSDPEGAAVPVEYVVRPIRSRTGTNGCVVTVRDLRERRALEAGRLAAEMERDRLASIAEASPDLTLVGRSDGRFLWMNPAGRRLLGLEDSEDITRFRIEDMFSAEEMERVYAEDMPTLARDGDWQGEWTLQSREGASIPVWVTHHVHYDAEGKPAYVSGVMRDLRPQREQERARRDSERRLAAAERVAGMGSWEWDPVTDRVMWSPGMYRLHGMEEGDGEESFEAWSATIHPDDRESVLAHAERQRFVIGPDEYIYRALRADGSVIVIHNRGEMFANERGEPVSMVGTLLDITDRHVAAEALRESEERARSVIATAGDAYVQFGPDGAITEWNDEAERSFGWPRNEVLGLTLSELILAPAERTEFERRVGLGLAPLDHQAADRFETTVRHRAGREFPVEVSAWTVQTGKGPVLSCLLRDISERLAAEQAKNEFVSVVGHELRTPLTSIHGALGLLRAGLLGELTERGQSMADIAVRNTERLVRLINDILDIERLNSGQVTVHRQECDVAELASRSVDAMRPLADEAGVRLLVDVPPAQVWADPDRVEQTLTNLLSNAIKFSPRGGIVWLEGWTDRDRVTIRVRDQGRGIPPEHLERIFDRFQQVDGSDSREKGGTGLGLAICRTIVEQHGGRIWADSAPDSGATLTLALPLGRNPAHEPLATADLDRRPRAVAGTDDESVLSAVEHAREISAKEPAGV